MAQNIDDFDRKTTRRKSTLGAGNTEEALKIRNLLLGSNSGEAQMKQQVATIK